MASEVIRKRLGKRARDAVLFDVGANIRRLHVDVREVFGPQARIWAFEPAGSNFALLERRLGEKDRVFLRNIGLSDREGTGILRSPSEESKLGSLHDTHIRLESRGLPLVVEERVALESIDSFCARERIERIDLPSSTSKVMNCTYCAEPRE